MFGNAERMERLRNFTPTSKTQLRRFAMEFAEGNVAKAREIYDFYAEGIDLPDTDPVTPTKMQVLKETATDVMDFVRDNKDDMLTAVSFVRSLFGKSNAAENIVEPITRIN